MYKLTCKLIFTFYKVAIKITYASIWELLFISASQILLFASIETKDIEKLLKVISSIRCLFVLRTSTTLYSSIYDINRRAKASLNAGRRIFCVRFEKTAHYIMHTWFRALGSHVEPYRCRKSGVGIFRNFFWMLEEFELAVVFAFDEDIRELAIVKIVG